MNPPEVQKTYEDVDNPSHGTVRSARWSLLSIEELEGITEVRLGTELKEKSLFLEVRYRLGSRLEMVMTTTNKGDHGVSYCYALHSYFAISDIASVAVDGFDGAEYLDMIDGWKPKLQEGYITVEEEVDRLYPGGAKALKLLDAGWQRQIEIHSPESNSTVVWNPWVEKASRTSQMLAEDFRQFICIETAKVGDDFVSLAAGESETLTLMLSSKSLT